MKTHVHLKNRWLRGWLLFLTMGFPPLSLAMTCPDVATILSGVPNSSGTLAHYLSPGWSSDEVPTIDLADTTFSRVYVDDSGTQCIYDTNQGFLVLYPNNNQTIDTSQLVNTPYWRCEIQQENYNNLETETVCTCDESLTACSFTLQ